VAVALVLPAIVVASCVGKQQQQQQQP